ncbi:unnamed protein product, partial [Gulo gulo]
GRRVGPWSHLWRNVRRLRLLYFLSIFGSSDSRGVTFLFYRVQEAWSEFIKILNTSEGIAKKTFSSSN